MLKSNRSANYRLLQTTALALALGASPALAQSFDSTGFSISIDQLSIAGAPAMIGANQRADMLAYALDVDIRYDGLDTRRMLNIATIDARMAYAAGEMVAFRTSSNYPYFISRGEVRIIDLGARGTPVIARVPAQANGAANWQMPDDGSGSYAYVVRVYDAMGRYDESRPVVINRADTIFETQPVVGAAAAVGLGEDNTARRGIPVRGGVITASGGGAVPGGTVAFMGEEVPVDSAGNFVISRIMPVGDHVVSVNANGRNIVRDVNIPASEWFHVGIADITAGWNFGGSDNEDSNYVNGRVAFYVKGQTASGWMLTSSLDTGDGPISEILSRLDDKDTRHVLERLRTDGAIYSTYGDDSTYFDDTPTSGRVYLRAENENIRAVWGDFTAGMNSASLLHNSRDLYGAEIQYHSTATTGDGEARVAGVVYAAQPDTLAQKDIFRGTGGSVYFLSHQDINGGSVNLSIQVVDPDTGRVISSNELREGVDYRIDHVQGMLLLSSPLAASAAGTGVVSSGSDNAVNLVAFYEYTPVDATVDNLSYGAHGEIWVSDRLRFGATLMQESTVSGDQLMASGDVRLQIGQSSFAELEYAYSEGVGIGYSTSLDGGLTIISSAGVASAGANAIHFDSHFALNDLGIRNDGFVDVYYESKQAGFATLGEEITDDQFLLGVNAEIALGERLNLGADAEYFERANGDNRTEGEVRLAFALSDAVSLEAGVQFVDKTTIGDPTETGQRTDIGLRANLALSESTDIYAFGQATLNVSGGLSSNNRYGLGFDSQLNERLALSGEYSTGDAGDGASFRLTYAASDSNEVYLGYTLDPTRSGAGGVLNDNGRIVLGGRYQLSDTISTYTESVYDMPDNQRSLTQIYGVTYTGKNNLTLATSLEMGEVADDVSGDFDRLAVSLGAAYNDGDDMSWRARLEYRDEEGAGTARDRTTWGLSAGYANAVNENWRLLASVDALLSESAEGDFRDGRYVRASLGFAYRPVNNEKLNLLFGYTYLNDQPGEDQVSANGTTDGPLQISNIFSVNAGYDLSNSLSLSAKLGYRISEIADRGTTTFVSNTAALGVLRADWHIVNNWDIMGEGRLLYTPETDTYETGVVAGVYRHLGDHLKLGVGYEWGAVSDDLADINYSGQGVFLNLVAKY